MSSSNSITQAAVIWKVIVRNRVMFLMPMNNREDFLDDPHMVPPNLKVLGIESYSAPRAVLF